MAPAHPWRPTRDKRTALHVGMLLLALLWTAMVASTPLSPDHKISATVRNADIHTVLYHLVEVGGVNRVVGPDVTGTITLSLREVPWEQGLETILTRIGLTQERQGKGHVRDTCLSRARHKPVYLEPLVMSSKVGERMSGRDIMPLSST